MRHGDRAKTSVKKEKVYLLQLSAAGRKHPTEILPRLYFGSAKLLSEERNREKVQNEKNKMDEMDASRVDGGIAVFQHSRICG